MATITSDTYLDGGTARTAGEAWTCNGGKLIIRTDSRWHANAPASMTGSLGAVTSSGTLGGGYEIDGTKVRWLAYNSGSGNVPAIGTDITQAGVSSSYLLGVYADLTSAPTSVGSAMPASGYIKFREVSGVFEAGALVGIDANAISADVVGWIEIVHDQAVDLTFRRLGSGFKVAGDWFALGTTNGNAGQTFQVPTNGGGSTTHVPAIQVETGEGTGLYEWYPCLITGATYGWNTTYMPTDVRGKFAETVGNGIIRLGSDGANSIGYVPPSGCRVRIPNVFGRQCTTGQRSTNALPSTTLASRPELAVTGAGAVNIDKFTTDWFISLNGSYSVSLKNIATEAQILIRNCPTAPVLENSCVTKYVSVAAYCLDLQTNVNGGTIKNNVFVRYDGASSGYAVYLNNCAGNQNSKFLIDNNTIYQSISAARNAAGYALYLINCAYVEIKDLKQIGHSTYINTCSNITVSSIDHTDRITGSTNTTTGLFVVYIVLSKDILCDFNTTGLTFGFNGSISNVHPYGGLFSTGNNLGGIKFRRAGSFVSKLSAGSSNKPGYVWQGAGNEVDISVQRCYLDDVRTLVCTAPNTTKGVLVEHCYGSTSLAQTMICLDGIYRNIKSLNTVSGQTSVYGTHWLDCFSSDSSGRIVLAFNEPTAGTASYITTVFGDKAGFTSTGQVVMPNLNDQLVIETPYFIKGYTALTNSNPTITGTNTGNFTYQYQIDTGSGWSDWKTLDASTLSQETISPAGFKLKYKITTSTGNASNALTYIRIDADSTESAQQNNLYPLDTSSASLTLSGIADGSIVKVYNSNYSSVLDTVTLSGSTTYTYSYAWNSTDGNINVNVLIWKNNKQVIRLSGLTLTDISQSFPISQSDDLIYGTASTDATIDFTNKLFVMNSGVTQYDVQGIYSLWKEAILNSTNAQYDFAFSILGGNSTSGSNSIPYYTYLMNGWRVRPDEADHSLNVTNGILLVNGGGDPFVDTLGDYTVRINYQQPVQAIAVLSGSGLSPEQNDQLMKTLTVSKFLGLK